MSSWSLEKLLAGLHGEIQRRLETARHAIGHPGSKGDASESVWLDLLSKYLPKRYQAETAHVVDSEGEFSEQIDVVIFDRQYSPFIFHFEGQIVVPAESVYAVFESKQSASAEYVKYAQQKVASVRRLSRTSLPIPHAGGTYPAKPPISIYGGLLTFESDWNPPLGQPILKALEAGPDIGKLDLGCVAAHGYFAFNKELGHHEIVEGGKPATAFLFRLISELQFSGTVPMIDIRAYARWLTPQ